MACGIPGGGRQRPAQLAEKRAPSGGRDILCRPWTRPAMAERLRSAASVNDIAASGRYARRHVERQLSTG